MTPSRTEDPTPQSRCRFALKWCDITPPENIYHRMWGAAKHERATGIHRPLRATAVVFAPLQGDGRQIVLALDHCILGRVEQEQLLAQVADRANVPQEEVLIVCSHTHGAGLMGLDRIAMPGGDLIPGYLRKMGDVAAGLVKQAVSAAKPATITYGRGQCTLAAHRDFYDGARGHYVCGFNPGVPADDTVIVARVTDEFGKTLASIVNYACHPTTLAWENTLISPDYIGAMREEVERDTGAPCLFLQGASGELGPREGFVGDTAVADKNGRELGFAALAALTALSPAGTKFVYTGPVVSGATLGDWEHRPLADDELAAQGVWTQQRWHEPLTYRPGSPTVEDTKKARDELSTQEAAARAVGDDTKAADLRALVERKNRLLHRLMQLPPGDAYPLQVVLWRMGDATWLGVQGESYSILQTELRRRFPDRVLIIATIAANWGASYLPPRELYGTGIYQESIAVVGAGSLEQLIESIAERIAVIS
ncbi:MAG: neutral/alkaline non-lysosomal ceramidase N-terminal domain-containing protein [Prosthecobacter sp.]